MRNNSHKSLIGTVREHVIAWRQENNWSRETVVQMIVEAHERINGSLVSGIRFEPPTQDVIERQKVNADRVFRWLDDQSKDSTLLPANFLPSVLAAMPVDVRLSCVDEILLPLGLGTRCIGDPVNAELNVHNHLREMLKETSEGMSAYAELMVDPNVGAMERAHKELSESIATQGRARHVLESTLSRIRAGASKISGFGRSA